jgi:rfaE bifunctional protein kinase chain/domain
VTTKTRLNGRDLIKWVERFSQVPILVVGDLMLDRTLKGSVDRVSPEAPVPVVDIKEESFHAGGAGNVVLNLQALGAKPTLLTVRGDDDAGQKLVSQFRQAQLDTSGILVDAERPTTTKTRIFAGHQQVARYDREKRITLSQPILEKLMGQLRDLAPKFKVVMISDYGKGVISKPVIKAAIREAHRAGAAVIVDPKIEHFQDYKGADCLTPNTKEAVEGMRVLPPKTEEEVIALGWKIVKRLGCRSLLITRGEKGMAVFQKSGGVELIPTEAREVFDVTGAGDTVISTFSLARAVGAPVDVAARLANFAASLVVAKLGTAVATQRELIQLLRSRN